MKIENPHNGWIFGGNSIEILVVVDGAAASTPSSSRKVVVVYYDSLSIEDFKVGGGGKQAVCGFWKWYEMAASYVEEQLMMALIIHQQPKFCHLWDEPMTTMQQQSSSTTTAQRVKLS